MDSERNMILYVGGFELPDKNAAAHRVVANAKALAYLGNLVTFIGVSKEPQESGQWQDEGCYGFPYYLKLYPESKIEWFKHISNISVESEFIIEHKAQLRAVIAYNQHSIALKKTMSLCKSYGIPIIADCTEWYGHKWTSPMGIIKSLDTLIRMRFLHPSMDGLIAISKYLQKFYEKSVRTVYIPPLVDSEDPKWQIKRSKKDKTNQDSITIVYAGSPGENKDRIELIVKAVQTSTLPITLRIIGIDTKSFIVAHPNLLKKDMKGIQFLGRLSHLEVLSELSRADYSCFFREKTRSNEAGFPTKFVESVSMGTPVITNRTSDIADYCKSGRDCYVIDELSEDSIRRAIEIAFKNNIFVGDLKMFDFHKYINDFRNLLT